MDKIKAMVAKAVEDAKVVLKANKVSIIAFVVGVVVGGIAI